MKRISLGGTAWFDLSTSVTFEEGMYWDGRNNISNATGSQWDHEILLFTRKGKWVLNSYGSSCGQYDRYTVISEASAVEWIVQNDRVDELGDLPADVCERMKAAVADLEV